MPSGTSYITDASFKIGGPKIIETSTTMISPSNSTIETTTIKEATTPTTTNQNRSTKEMIVASSATSLLTSPDTAIKTSQRTQIQNSSGISH